MALTVSEAVAEPLPKPPEYAVAVIRVSEVGDRAARARRVSTDRQRRAPRTARTRRPEQFKSPIEQRQRIEDTCRREGLELAEVFTEMDISGRKELHQRKGLLPALQAIEAGYAKVLVVAYFDRLVRNLLVQFEVVKRVEAVGGRVMAVDFGEINTKVAAQWLSSVVVGAMAEYQSRSVGERLASTQAMAIADGLAIGSIAPGYSEDAETRRLVVHPAEAKVMREAFLMRAEGASYGAVRRHMAAGGIVRGRGSVTKLLKSRTYLGELFHGQHRNVDSHEPIIDHETFERVQRIAKGEVFKPVPGRKSQLLLSGLRILRCGTCGHSLQAASSRVGDKDYRVYKCPPNLTCSKRVSIDARIADAAVADYVRQRLAEESATEGTGADLLQARTEAETAQTNYARAQRNLALSDDEDEAQQILRELKGKRDAAYQRVADLERRARLVGNAFVMNVAANWDAPPPRGLALQGKRDLISATLERVLVAPGHRNFRGAGRLSFIERGSE